MKIYKYIKNDNINLELIIYDIKEIPEKLCLFVHGVFHSAVHFDSLIKQINEFSNKNILCFSLSLRSHGNSSSNGYDTIKDYVNDIRIVIDYIFDNYKQMPFLIGHSLGTLIIQEYIYICNKKIHKKLPGIMLLTPVGITYKQMFLFFKNLPYKMYKLIFYVLFKLNTDKFLKDKNNIKQLFFSPFSNDAIIENCIKNLKREKLLVYTLLYLNNKIIKYNFPIYMVSGKYDVLTSTSYIEKVCKDYKKKGNNVKHIILKNSGHDVMLDNDYELLADYIINYV